MGNISVEEKYVRGYETLPEIDHTPHQPEMCILVPRLRSSARRLLIWRYERYVAVFDIGTIKSRPVLRCAYDVVVAHSGLAEEGFIHLSTDALCKDYYQNLPSIRMACTNGRHIPVTHYEALATKDPDRIIRAIKIPCNSKMGVTVDNVKFYNARQMLLLQIYEKLDELGEYRRN